MKPDEYMKKSVCAIKAGQPMVVTLKDGTTVKGGFVARRTSFRQMPRWALIEKISHENEKVHYISEESIEDVSLEPYGKPILIVQQSKKVDS
ncbi:hypothetical protein SAMN04487897_109150 [Paenibacillus sp. yr247]|uniref:hypothetical protein n=1 Tax=Paenibacillus sp. yr247 TaxID=1761880 RepID=UPI00089031EA|nr:hypothetical protein [Paenibacillus sp. yr247]SDO18828.1 hypothetical protein SAMN04487897_109150 [Paenibacillus sp. yr247]